MKTSEKASISAKTEVPEGDVNAVNPETATTEVSAKPEQVKSEDNPILQKLQENCSTFPKIRRPLAYVLRFVQNTRKKNVKTGPITVQELKESENQLFKWSQFHLKPSVVDKKLIPSLDENGIIRAHGRLEDVRLLPQEMRNPVILPRDHPLVRLLLRHLHEKRGHCGYKSLIHEARGNYWIIGVRNTSKALTEKCITCRKLRKKLLDQLIGRSHLYEWQWVFHPFPTPPLTRSVPYISSSIGRHLKEAQVVIFACMISRAVHLELVDS